MERGIILGRLLQKYESSKHLTEPNTSKRRVMLRIEKGDLPEYEYESVQSRDRFNAAARELEDGGIIEVKWLKYRPVISEIVLNLQQVEKAYQTCERPHPAQAATELCAMINSVLPDAKTPWIKKWRDDVYQTLCETLRPPSFCKLGDDYAREFFNMLAYYDQLDGAEITARTFSIACFQNSKRFELEFQDEFLRMAMRYHPELSEISEREELGDREKLAILGIYLHPELYLLAGHFSVKTQTGEVDASPLFPYGFALPSASVSDIDSFRLKSIQRVIFIENFANYNEYLQTEIIPEDIVVYHGGFSSPTKRRLYMKLRESLSPKIETFFWADIDLGGFQMFYKLQAIFPELKPMRMAAADVLRYASYGLARDDSYLKRLQTSLNRHEFPLFEDAIRTILKLGVTTEQEVFLSNAPSHI